MSSKELIKRAKHFLPEIEHVREYLEKDYETLISRGFPGAEHELRTCRTGWPEAESVESEELTSALKEERRQILEAGLRAITKIEAEGEDAYLGPIEGIGLEAIILIQGRPALLIQDGHFSEPPPEWEILEEKRESIERNCQSVGRIELLRHPSRTWAGTGFLVAEDVVMTNRHVAITFCSRKNGDWVFFRGVKPRIDYAEEPDKPSAKEFFLTEVIGVHRRLDLALFKVSKRGSHQMKPPEPLTIASEVSGRVKDRYVYVLGYPYWDPFNNDPEVMHLIFDGIYGVKRLQPGKLTKLKKSHRLFEHDCSTLGGNSGSCVIDLDTGLVVGLHFGGKYKVFNSAVALWLLRDDPLLTDAGVQFD